VLSVRSNQKEQMDNFELSGKELNETLSGLTFINKYLGNTAATFKAVKTEIAKAHQTLKILDLGCGGGDNLRAIAKWCSINNKSIELIGLDGNAHILEYAKKLNNKSLTIKYLQADILDSTFELPKCDILISSHFMYHFSDIELVQFLKKSNNKVSTKIIFSELKRSYLAYSLFKIGSILLPFSKIVMQDGLLAIKRAFTKKEITSILHQADLIDYEIHRKWLFRFLISIPVKDKAID
jgi:2-polyprenyl-3-methyl-5-hydroxy-6-metoxy-1,4-benzoquinol methylase|tara:strand:+ start:16632 stop:17345 length:714 start_codon:yes stop_codon:yes gene_type:complete